MSKLQILFVILFLVAGGGMLAALLPNQDTEVVFLEVASEEFRALGDQEQLSYIKKMAQDVGVREAKKFVEVAYPEQPADKHELIHMVGEAAFLKYEYKGLDSCDSFFNFGCYHGVVLEAIRQKGYSNEVLQDLASGCLGLARNRTTITACIHGVGHGLMVVRSYELLLSYEDCDTMFTNPEDLFFCYDGVSMENVMRRFEQADAADYLTSKDPLYPCNAVPQKYQAACAREHIFHARRVFYGNDTEKTAAYCLYFPEEFTRFECFSALGTVLNQEFFEQPKLVIEECKKVGEYGAPCITRGATQYAFARQFGYASMLCDSIPSRPERENCVGSIEYAKSTL